MYPNNNNTSFDGTWSNYPYYGSGNIVVTSIDEGLFVLRPTLTPISHLLQLVFHILSQQMVLSLSHGILAMIHQ